VCVNFIYSELNYSERNNFGPEELLMLHTANTTVEACAESVSALYSHLALNPALTITWVKRTFATSRKP